MQADLHLSFHKTYFFQLASELEVLELMARSPNYKVFTNLPYYQVSKGAIPEAQMLAQSQLT